MDRAASGSAFTATRLKNSSAARPSPRSARVPGSGVVASVSMAMPQGWLNPVINDAFTTAREVVYSPIVPLTLFETNRLDPDTAIPAGPLNPVIKDALTTVPEVVYWPIVPLP